MEDHICQEGTEDWEEELGNHSKYSVLRWHSRRFYSPQSRTSCMRLHAARDGQVSRNDSGLFSSWLLEHHWKHQKQDIDV
jgi:hypothetical protein